SAAERERVPHHLIDVLDPWESSSVVWWRERAAACCRDIEQRVRRPLLVSSTPLYLKALLYGLFDGPAADESLRHKLTDQARQEGTETLHRRLGAVDPLTAARVHPNDLRRIIRALEVWEITGRPMSAWQTQWSAERGAPSANTTPNGDENRSALRAPRSALSRVLWLDLPRDKLYERINCRVESMFAAGLVDEVRALRDHPKGMNREASQALGYKEVLAYLEGGTTLAETMALVQMRSRNFAKRQISWFRHLPECRPVNEDLT